jgi:hypothetical protein
VKIPRYWAKETHEARDAQGRLRAFACWRWSDASVEEARREAKARAIEIARKFLSHERLDWNDGPESGGEAHPAHRAMDPRECELGRYTTCKLVREIGAGRIHPDVERILSVHDRLACQGTDRGLA